MDHKPLKNSILPAWIFGGLAAFCCLPSAHAAETYEAFLQALKARGYNDMAVVYLERLVNSDATPAAWKRRAAYERGVLLIEQAGRSREAGEAETLLGDGLATLRRFVEAHPDAAEAPAARGWIAKSVARQARLSLTQFRAATDDQRERARQQATQRFEAALTAFAQRIAAIESDLEMANREQAGMAEAQLRDQLRADLIGARLESALIEFEQAELSADDPTAYQAQLETARTSFASLAQDYNKRLAGFEARYYQGRCYEAVGDLREALSFYEPFFSETELPLPVAAKPIARAIEIWTDPTLGEAQQAVTRGEAWLAKTKPPQASLPAAQVRLALAKAHQVVGMESDPAEARKATRVSRELLLAAAGVGGPHQQEARTLLARHAPATTEASEKLDRLRSFEAARQAGEEAHQQLLASDALVEMLRRNLESMEAADNRSEVESQIAETESSQGALRDQALAAFRRSLFLVTPEDDPAQVQQTQYLTSFMMYEAGQYHEAAVLSGHVAMRDPTAPVARQCANVAMASYWELYQQAEEGASRDRAAARIVKVADFIATTWPSDPSAQDALANLVSFMVNEGQVDRAMDYLSQIPADSPQRTSAELRVGQAIWRQYLQQLDAHRRANAEARFTVLPKELEKLREQARTVLAAGLESFEGDAVDQNTAQAALALAQANIESRAADAAERQLKHPVYGPIRLLAEDSPLAQVPGFAEQAYKTLVRAKIGQLPEAGGETEAILDEATRALDLMQQSAGDSDEGQQRLARSYVSLAGDLRRQLEVAGPTARAAIAAGFETFVARVTASSTDPTILNWAGETLLGLAESSDEATAQGYFQGAREAFETLLATSSDPPLSPDLARQAKLRLATTLRKLKRHEEAINLLEAVLKEQNALLNVQAEAARTYQEAGEYGAVRLFDYAIKGGRKDTATGKNTIWGWEGIASRTAAQRKQSAEKKARFSDAFFEARYNIALCRYRQSLKSSGEESAKYRSQARRALAFTTRLYPDLGEGRWKQEFETLKAKIEDTP